MDEGLRKFLLNNIVPRMIDRFPLLTERLPASVLSDIFAQYMGHAPIDWEKLEFFIKGYVSRMDQIKTEGTK